MANKSVVIRVFSMGILHCTIWRARYIDVCTWWYLNVVPHKNFPSPPLPDPLFSLECKFYRNYYPPLLTHCNIFIHFLLFSWGLLTRCSCNMYFPNQYKSKNNGTNRSGLFRRGGGVLINLPSSASRADIEEQNPIAVSLSALWTF